MPETALVTGASSGIGEQFARQLAGRGHDLVLVARRADRLERLAAELPTEAHVVACDLATDAASLAGRVQELGADVDLLVNNAGFGTSGPFLEHDPERDAEQVRLNCEAVVTLSHAFLPGMVDRRRGGVINVASSAGFQPIPYESVYAATKAFVISFTDALHTELRGSGVRAMSVNPGPVPTEWQQVAGYREERTGVVPGEISAEQVVSESLEAWDRGRRSVIPGRTIRWFIRATAPSPRAIQLRITERMYRPKR
ncbi:MAG TPA: SDR family oxidoreductase [Solirubrobacterales bacterium]|nr:SDR family oxidoreductase [Solirubrobacterales bacterium]